MEGCLSGLEPTYVVTSTRAGEKCPRIDTNQYPTAAPDTGDADPVGLKPLSAAFLPDPGGGLGGERRCGAVKAVLVVLLRKAYAAAAGGVHYVIL